LRIIEFTFSETLHVQIGGVDSRGLRKYYGRGGVAQSMGGSLPVDVWRFLLRKMLMLDVGQAVMRAID
jgi:hypothetical protein